MFLFDHLINSFVTIVSPWSYLWLHSESSPRPCLLFRPCKLMSIHPSTHLARVRRDGPSGERDGATAGAQSDKERQITPLTRTIHHCFISHPSLPPHLHLKYSAPARQLQEKKKISTLFPMLFSFSRNSRCSGNQHALLLRWGEIMKRKRRKKQQDKGNAEWLNEQHIRRRGGKKTPTHPCWHVWRLITMAAVSTDVELRGSCQSVRVCVRVGVWQ